MNFMYSREKKVKNVSSKHLSKANANVKMAVLCRTTYTPGHLHEDSDTCLFDNILPVGVRVRGVERKDVGDEVVMRSIHCFL